MSLFSSQYDLSLGDRVVVVAWSLRGTKGTLIRRTRLPWNGRRAWLVELDNARAPGGKRQRLGEGVLLPMAAFHDDQPQ